MLDSAGFLLCCNMQTWLQLLVTSHLPHHLGDQLAAALLSAGLAAAALPATAAVAGMQLEVAAAAAAKLAVVAGLLLLGASLLQARTAAAAAAEHMHTPFQPLRSSCRHHSKFSFTFSCSCFCTSLNHLQHAALLD